MEYNGRIRTYPSCLIRIQVYVTWMLSVRGYSWAELRARADSIHVEIRASCFDRNKRRASTYDVYISSMATGRNIKRAELITISNENRMSQYIYEWKTPYSIKTILQFLYDIIEHHDVIWYLKMNLYVINEVMKMSLYYYYDFCQGIKVRITCYRYYTVTFYHYFVIIMIW